MVRRWFASDLHVINIDTRNPIARLRALAILRGMESKSSTATKSGTKTAVALRGLTKSFGEGPTRLEVLHGVDLEVDCGEMLLMAGPSGCGKTTILCLIAGLLDPDKGTIEVFGQALEKLSLIHI